VAESNPRDGNLDRRGPAEHFAGHYEDRALAAGLDDDLVLMR
jgi:hypothetical protein